MKERGLARKKERPHSQPVRGDVLPGQVQPYMEVLKARHFLYCALTEGRRGTPHR